MMGGTSGCWKRIPLGMGAGGQDKQSSLGVVGALCPLSLPQIPFPEAAWPLCLSFCLQLGAFHFENKHWDQFWELKDLDVRKDWAGLSFAMGTLSCPHVGKKVGRGPQNKKHRKPWCGGWSQPGKLAIGAVLHRTTYTALPDQGRECQFLFFFS